MYKIYSNMNLLDPSNLIASTNVLNDPLIPIDNKNAIYILDSPTGTGKT